MVLHVRVCGDALGRDFNAITGQFRGLRLLVFAMYVLNGFLKLLGQVRTGNRGNCVFITAVLGALGGRDTKDHLRMADEIAIDGIAFRSLGKIHPFRQLGCRSVVLLQENNIRYDFRSGIGFESVVGKTDSAQEDSPLR